MAKLSAAPAQLFSRETLRFLTELAANNDREWFAANKPRYEAVVLEPALAFISAMGPAIARLSPHLLAVPKRMGGSLMRIHRDTRFGHDKSPYKTNIGIQFRHERGKDVHAPGFYVHIEPKSCFLGAGIWRPEPEPLYAIRTRIAAAPDAWRKASTGRRFTETFALSGEQLKRPPRGFAPAGPEIDAIKRKDFIAIADVADRDVLSPDFPKQVAARLKATAPLMAFLCAALELQYWRKGNAAPVPLGDQSGSASPRSCGQPVGLRHRDRSRRS